jgi:leucyl/phenylalanyl-tRNA---protein transferase
MIRISILRPGDREAFPPVSAALDEPEGLLAAGGDLSSERLLDAYRHGIFPWYSAGQPILWWSPNPRMVFATDAIHVSSRLQRWLKHSNWSIRADTAFAQVMQACAQPRRGQPTTWITSEMFAAYTHLHELGYAHSVEVYDTESRLVGGIYGVAVGRMFFGESMFSFATNASKVALIALCRALRNWDFPLLDAQVESSHLASMGAFEMPREEFVAQVASLSAGPSEVGSWSNGWNILRASDLS